MICENTVWLIKLMYTKTFYKLMLLQKHLVGETVTGKRKGGGMFH